MLDFLQKIFSGGASREKNASNKQDRAIVKAQKALENMPLGMDEPERMVAESLGQNVAPAETVTAADSATKERGMIFLQPEVTSDSRPRENEVPTTHSHTADNLMIVEVKRYSTGTHDTLGKMFINGEFQCYTLEDEFREEKVRGDTRIPTGEYNITLRTEGGKHATYWHRFPEMHKGMLWIRNVPNFEYILIHIGNSDVDTEGCILVGTEPLNEDKTDTKRKIIASTAAYQKIYPVLATHLDTGKPAVIRVSNEA